MSSPLLSIFQHAGYTSTQQNQDNTFGENDDGPQEGNETPENSDVITNSKETE
jgi:hypothetical protein